ncbi:MAG TPA: hypothetical protein VGV85_18500, partial [Longimicrobiaceae bacterium]|nr:hypothetical protein [Longimicrobiaceae bacterium]
PPRPPPSQEAAMPFSLPFRSRSRRSALLPAGMLALALAACGGGGDESAEARPEDVDMSTPVAVTEEEIDDFEAPADSVLTPAQVEAYLKTSLLQYDLIRKESVGIHARVAEMEERGKDGGTLGGLRNMVAAGQTMYQVGDLIGGSYIRSARSLGYNPAEMEWVRERMTEVAGHLMMKPMYEQSVASAAQMRTQAEELRTQMAAAGSAGFTEADVQQMLASADQAEAQAREQMAAGRAVQANLEVLHRARPAVTDAMWGTVGFAGGAQGLIALSGLSDPNDAEAQKKLDEFRVVYQDALANRVSKGMENAPAAQPQP